MFENILTKENVSFKEMEQICFKIACEFAKQMLKAMLEEYDKKLMNNRDTKVFRNKGLKETTVKTMVGEVEYKRRMYTNEDKKCVYLLDETINTKGVGNVSDGVINLIIDNIKNLSYRACAETISETTGITISSVGVWNIIQGLGIEIESMENEKIKAFDEDMLEKGSKEIPVLYQEADGIMIYTQGKDRKEQYEKYKKEHNCEEVPKKARNVELKLGMTYEGWKDAGTDRYELVGKEYVVGFMTGEKMAQITNANLHSKYNMGSVEIRVLNSDGGRWIQELKTEKTFVQADVYHFREKIKTSIRDEEDIEKMLKLYQKRQYEEMMKFATELKFKYDGEYEEVKKIETLEKYCSKRKEQMKRYNEDKNIKEKLKAFSKETGLKYRNMGCQESNNYSLITRRMKRRRMSWSKKGAQNIAKVIATRASESTKDIISQFSFKQLPEEFRNYAEKYIQEIENNIKWIKKNKSKKKVPKMYECKAGTLLGNEKIKSMIDMKPITDLIYR